MIRLACLLALMLTGCASTNRQLECDVARDSNGKAQGAQLAAVVVAKDVWSDARTLRFRLASKRSLAGFTGSLASRFNGTDAFDFAIEMNQLRGNLALLKALEFASMNDGDTLIGTKADWQCRTLADSVASLDLGQSGEQLVENLGTAEKYAELVR